MGVDSGACHTAAHYWLRLSVQSPSVSRQCQTSVVLTRATPWRRTPKGPQHRLQTANQGVQYIKGVYGLPNDHQLPATVMFKIPRSLKIQAARPQGVDSRPHGVDSRPQGWILTCSWLECVTRVPSACVTTSPKRNPAASAGDPGTTCAGGGCDSKAYIDLCS